MRALQVLLVDDDAEFRETLRYMLEHEGCSVFEAANGQAALHILRSILPQLILFDLEMPVMNGWEFYAALQKDAALAAIPIGVVSSVSHRRPAGSMHVLTKPVDLENLLGLLQVIDSPR